MHNTTFRPTRLAQALLLALSLCGPAWAQQSASAQTGIKQTEVQVEIAAQPVEAALDSLAAQTGIQLIYPTSGFRRDMMSAPVSGTHSVESALKQLLAPTGMRYEFVNDRTIAIRNAGAAQASPQTAAGNTGSGQAGDAIDHIIVTGSRLTLSDPASPMIFINAADIERSGVSNIEELLRKLPQNLMSRSSAATALFQSEYGTNIAPPSQLGNTAINLRGMGSASTLVLVNGRRRATSAQTMGEFTDISSIPLSQIDYIEIVADGASAVYGADAVAGVVNIVLKKDFVGTTTQLRYENSNHKADGINANIGHTFGWGTGSLTFMGGYERSKSADLSGAIRKGPMGVGDFTAEGGVNTRKLHFGSPGAVFDVTDWGGSYYEIGNILGYIPSGNDGSTVSEASLLAPGSQPMRSIYEYNHVGPATQRTSARIEGLQDAGSGFQLDFGAGYTRQDNREIWRPLLQDFPTISETLYMPMTVVTAENVHNTFGRPVAVSYDYAKELENLRFSANQAQTNTDAYIGIRTTEPWRGKWHLETALSYSAERMRSDRVGDLQGSWRQDMAPVDRFKANINPFGNGSNAAIVDANRALLEGLVQRDTNRAWSSGITWDGMVRGSLFSLPAGKAEMVLGAQYRTDKNRSQFTNVSMSTSVNKFDRQSQALFTEWGFPLLKNAPLAKELNFSIAARYERFDQAGTSRIYTDAYRFDADGNIIGNLVEEGGFNLMALAGVLPGPRFDYGPAAGVSRSYSNLSPLARISWKPHDDLRLRTTWGKSFVTPTGNQLFGNLSVTRQNYRFSQAGGVPLPPGVDHVIQLSGPNPNLKPQVAATWTLGFDWRPQFVQGFALSMTYSDIQYDNYIGSPTIILENLKDVFAPTTVLPAGTLTLGNNKVMLWDARDVNYAGRRSRTLDINTGYDFSNAWGDWGVDLNLTRTLELSVQTVASLPKVELAGTDIGPSKWAGNLMFTWERNDFSAAIGANYSSGFNVRNPLSSHENYFTRDPATGMYKINPSPRRTAGGYPTFDVQVGYHPQASDGWMKGLSVRLGAQNLFDRQFAFVDNAFGFVTNRSGIRGRVLYLDVKKEF